MPKYRQINRPGNGIGKLRQAIYAAGISRIKQAIRVGYALEAITLCESLMSDRLEARIAWKRNQASEARRFFTLGKLARKLKTDTSEPEQARGVYSEVEKWADERNEALHEMFKLAESETRDWPSRYKQATQVATCGLILSNKVSALMKKLNKAIPSQPVESCKT